jgi:hypothetical protein
MPLPDQLVGAPIDGLTHLRPESSRGERAAVAGDKLPVEPGRAVARHLPVEIVGREDTHLDLGPLGGVMGGCAGLEVLRDEPAVGPDPLDDAGAAKGFEASDVSVDLGVEVSAPDREIAVHGERPVLAWTIDPGATGDPRNVVIGRALGTGRADLDDGPDRRLLGG